MRRKPSQRRRKVSRDGNNFHSKKINPVMFLIKRKLRAVAEAIKKKAVRDGGDTE